MSYNIDRFISSMTSRHDDDLLGYLSYVQDIMTFIAYT